MGVRIRNTKEVRVQLHHVTEHAKAQVNAAIVGAALDCEALAKLHCPVDTGRLRASIETTQTEHQGAVTARVGTNVEYAPYVEFGTSQQAAQPFLYPAFQVAAHRLQNDLDLILT